ncbi:MAG: hypothetical protein QNK37_03115 [Acidobacteriota bacterium]|nr:hypothetical protein [Acidobacteriota bacterium]
MKFCKYLIRPVHLFLFLWASCAWSQTWEPLTGDDLRELFSDTVIEATLRGGVKAVATYKRDGTGVVKAWGGEFDRTWEVRGDNTVCIGIGAQETCYKLERNTATPNSYRSINQTTGEILELTIKADKTGAADTPTTTAGGAAKPSADEIAAKLANPNGSLATLNFKLQYRTYDGDLPNACDQSSTTLLFQPALPFKRQDGSTVFFRPAIPIQLDSPVFDAGADDFDSEAGLGDIAFDLAYGKTSKSGFLWALGMIAAMPTATEDALGTDRWTLGPELLLGKLSKKYVLVFFPNHQWSLGDSEHADINLTSIQLTGTVLPGGGWNLGTSPLLTYDHESSQWSIPLNFSFGKTVIRGGRPWKLGMEANYFLEQPDAFGPEWFIGLSVAPVVENGLAKWFQ